MIGFLRFASILNAAIWCGASVFVIIGVPAIFSSPEIRQLFAPGYVGFPAQAILARYFELQYICAGVAVLHLLVEWLYLGKPIQRFMLWLLVGMTGFVLLGGLVFQPKLQTLHRAKYWSKTVEQRKQAGQVFPLWHGASEIANLLVAGGLVVYLWRVSRSTETSRFVGFGKIRS